MCGEGLEMIYPFEGVSVLDVWGRALQCLRYVGRCPEVLSVGGVNEPVENIEVILARTGARHFGIEGSGWWIHYGCNKNYDHSLLQFRSSERLGIPFWQAAAPLFNIDRLISGRALDLDYEHWQNAHDPLQYRAAGRSHDHLPHVSNCLPYPLEQQIIDISRNPGRRIIRDGFVEAVGAVMWLGAPFFERTNCDLASLRALSGACVNELSIGVIEVLMQDSCFTRSDGEERDRQLALRCALFGVT